MKNMYKSLFFITSDNDYLNFTELEHKPYKKYYY